MPDPADGPRIRELSTGVPGGLRGLVELFISHTSEAANQLRKAADEGRVVDVQVLSHRGAGTAGAIGAARLMSLFRELESTARQSMQERLASLVTDLEEELARVHAYLSSLIESDGETDPGAQ